ncbi:hypothetical protein NRY95_05290 [Xanthomonas campestris pv. phormiicola]|nr:hypothetical protein [Xanthomonas campestris pv. phormiicola]UYC17377.1 hypothetical protein NRY95_05290 [Xanthomonas campestris pv. phormiicola]
MDNLECRLTQMESRLNALEAEGKALEQFVVAVISSHPQPVMLLAMIEALISKLPDALDVPAGQEERGRVLSQLLEMKRLAEVAIGSRKTLNEKVEARRQAQQIEELSASAASGVHDRKV